MLHKDSNKQEILAYIDCEVEDCVAIGNYFIRYPDITYLEMIDKVESIIANEPRAGGYIISVLGSLAVHSSIDINDKLIIILLNYQLAGYIQVLNLWRKIKHLPNISDYLKTIVIQSIKNKLPLIETEDEWDYTNTQGEVMNG